MEKFKKIALLIIEILSYIVWSTCLWFFTYFQINRSDIDNEYRLFALLFVASGLIYFKYKASDVIKELTCTVGTIIATATLAKVYNYGFDLKAVLTSVIVAIVYLAFTWVMIQNSKKERKIFGKYTIALNLFTFALLAVLLFGLNMNVAIAIAISLAINSIVGYFIFQHNLKSGDVSLQ